MKDNITILGLAKLKRDLLNLAQDMPKEIKKGIRKASKPVQRTMKSLVPRDSGALRKSIATKVKIARSGGIYAIVGVRSKFATTSTGKVAKRGESFHKIPNMYATVIEYGSEAFRNRNTKHQATKFREKTYRRHEQSTIVALTREIDLILNRRSTP